ncbi:MAG: acyltransferase family protein [Bacilli bacterium]|nr:acyltransferase family protein [Bacilli bacterium]
MNNTKQRVEWVDICKAIAIIFVFLGHWNTVHLKIFAYAFHLKLFFLLSGFFAAKAAEKYNFKEYTIKRIKQIIIPMILWGWIGIIINHFESPMILTDMITYLKGIQYVYPNYWFFPAIFTISLFYYGLKRLYKKDSRVLLCTYLLLLFFGKTPIIDFTIPEWWIFNYIYVKASFVYGFWFALGAFLFPYLKNWIEKKDTSEKWNKYFHIIGITATLITSALFVKDISAVSFIEKYILTNNILATHYNIISTSIIMISVIYFSTFLTKIEGLKFIGKNTMAHLGLEYITRTIVPIYIVNAFHLNFTLDTTVMVILLVIIQFWINNKLIKYINLCFPILNGEYPKKSEKIEQKK